MTVSFVGLVQEHGAITLVKNCLYMLLHDAKITSFQLQTEEISVSWLLTTSPHARISPCRCTKYVGDHVSHSKHMCMLSAIAGQVIPHGPGEVACLLATCTMLGSGMLYMQYRH